MSNQCQRSRGLWRNYLFVTREMGKFLAQDNVGMFLNLLEQREHLQGEIERVDDGGFKDLPEGQQLAGELEQINEEVVRQLERMRNQLEKQQKISVAYDVMRPSFLGNRMDQKG